jgi:hypothetical protein
LRQPPPKGCALDYESDETVFQWGRVDCMHHEKRDPGSSNWCLATRQLRSMRVWAAELLSVHGGGRIVERG